MSTDTTTPNAIPQRSDIEPKHTWNLADIYPDEKTWEADFARVEKLVEEAGAFVGKLAESPQILYDCLQLRSRMGQTMYNLSHYAHLARDLDNRASQYQELSDRAINLASKAAAAFSFIEPELLMIDEKQLLDMAGQFPKTDVYDFYIKELIRSRKHIRSQEVEEVLAMSIAVHGAPSNIFTMLDNADLKYGTINDEQGQPVEITKQRYAKFMESQDRRVRREAHETLFKAYQAHVNTLGASLSASVNRDVFATRVRHYDSSLEAALDGDNIPVSVYHSLLDTTEANLAGLHKYVGLRKKLLGLDEIRPYDLICPLFPDQDFEVKYDDAVKKVLEAVKPLGEQYCEDVRHAFGNRWVDVFETEGKGSGAYSSGNYNVHPFVLMNYNDTVDNMFTLAHELGHAMHSWLTSKAQPFEKSHYSIFVAEVASTLNEGLLLHYLLEQTDDARRRLYLLNRSIDNTVGTFFNQIMYARFELKTHEIVEQGGALSPDVMNAMWRELTQQYFGPAMAVDEATPVKWSRIPHFYTAYYVYQYATSYAASQAILDRFLAGEPGIINKYLSMLSAGGSDYPIEELKICGIDMTTPTPVEANIKLFAWQVDEMARLAG